MSSKNLYRIALKNQFNVESAESFNEALKKISNEKADKIDCYYHDIEAQPNEPTKYSVRGVPTILLFKGSKLLGTKVGAASEKDMLEFIEPHI